jgi:hypothetical protein
VESVYDISLKAPVEKGFWDHNRMMGEETKWKELQFNFGSLGQYHHVMRVCFELKYNILINGEQN